MEKGQASNYIEQILDQHKEMDMEMESTTNPSTTEQGTQEEMEMDYTE